MAAMEDADKYYLEKEEVIDDTLDHFKYEEVLVDEDFIPPELDEDLDFAVRTVREATEDKEAGFQTSETIKPSLIQKPEVVDDFVRNFLVRMGLMRTLDCFQTEWYELQQRGLLHEENIGVVPDVYSQNSDLDSEVKFLKQEVAKFRNAALKAKETYVKLRKERDYHRMHHKRVVQEKNKLIDDIKRLKRHYMQYEPTLQQLKAKYEVAMKEKMLVKLERDRVAGQVVGLQNTIKNLDSYKVESGTKMSHRTGNSAPPARPAAAGEKSMGPTQRALVEARLKAEKTKDVAEYPENFMRHPNDSQFPVDHGVNPNLNLKLPPGRSYNSGDFHITHTIRAHDKPVSSLALHPRKQILASCSDDRTWKIWSVPSGELIFTGTGHSEWVSDCDFHPSGSTLATTSGDTTVKIWNFTDPGCAHTFTDHTLAVWSCSWHFCGDFLATASMDSTTKIWDLNSLRCRSILRGHADSVNSVEFLHFSNLLLSSSADKTLSIWDARTGICAQTFYGHMHSVNHATFNTRGDTIASCDAYGVLKLWDIRKQALMSSIDLGPHPANKAAFNPFGAVVAVACNDGCVKMYDIASGQVSSLAGHEDAVQCVLFDPSSEFMVSGGSDKAVHIWA